MGNYSGIKFDSSKVDRGLYEDGSGSSYPTIVWHGKYSGNGSECGFWTLDRSESETAPGPFWEESSVQFGSSPEAPHTAVWKTSRLRACVLGVRKRVLIFGDDGGQYSYPWLTAKKDREPGKYKAHFQIAVTLPGTGEKIYQIALKGVSKTKAWGNPEKGPYHDPKFPRGVELMLRDLTAQASHEAKTEIPPFCTFWIDLIPFVNEKGKPHYIDIGYGTHIVAFTADIESGAETGLDHRFVGMDLFEKFQELRQGEIVDWIAQWDTKGESSPEDIDPYAEPADDILGTRLKEAF
jgi:hypothetical protein